MNIYYRSKVDHYDLWKPLIFWKREPNAFHWDLWDYRLNDKVYSTASDEWSLAYNTALTWELLRDNKNETN